ncbi:stalk domain-containing protein [Cohnella sp.]|uniref:stalk domain-containing protein n=1 Tax=Cohnella sp. TaxID=1883426 RepID=UPI0035680765
MHHMRKISIILIAALILVLIPISVNAEDDQPDFAALFEGAIILYLGSPNAVDDLSDRMIDEDNFNVTPFAYKSRTLVPIRFIGESLGANVNWNDKTSTVTIQGKSRLIKMKLGSTQMSVNGTVKKLDVPAQFTKGRLFVPLRAISEAFGKQVFYDRGVIVINDSVTLNPVKDRNIIDYLIFTLKPYHKDPYNGRTLTTEQLAVMDQSVVLLESFDRNGLSTGFGSAFAVGYGLFLTNYHVVNDASSYQIVTQQDRYYGVEGIVAVDPEADLALVKTAMRTNVPPLHIGSSKSLAKGQSIMTIGNPEGYQNTISTGIISGFRQNGASPIIQITAPITHGSSGGPLLNMKGEVVGVTSMGVEDSGNLNFATPIDLFKKWNAGNGSIPFANIAVLDQSQFEEPDNEDGSSPDPSESPAPSPAPESPSTLPSKNVHVLNRIVSEAELDPVKPIVYLSDDTQSQIVAYNYEEEKEVSVSSRFDKPIRKMTYANGELFVILSDAEFSSFRFDGDQGGTIAVLDPITLKLKDQWRTRVDPYDLAVDKSNHVYIASGSGQWTFILSFDRATHEEISSRSIRNASYITLHPFEDKIYTVDTDSSPRDIQVYKIENGLFTDSYDSPYHGDYSFTTSIGITPDGKYLLNGFGGIFTATNQKTTNMKYFSKIDPFDFMAGDPAHPETFFTSRQSTVHQYDSESLNKTRTINTNGTIIQIAVVNHRFIALTKVSIPGVSAPKYALEVLDLN